MIVLLHQAVCGAQAGAGTSLNKGTDHDQGGKGSLDLRKHLYISEDE